MALGDVVNVLQIAEVLIRNVYDDIGLAQRHAGDERGATNRLVNPTKYLRLVKLEESMAHILTSKDATLAALKSAADRAADAIRADSVVDIADEVEKFGDDLANASKTVNSLESDLRANVTAASTIRFDSMTARSMIDRLKAAEGFNHHAKVKIDEAAGANREVSEVIRKL